MDDVDVLESVLAKDQTLIGAVGDEQWGRPTPCPDFTVRHLVNHLAGWIQLFDAAANERTLDGDPTTYESDDPSADFQRASASLIAGWRSRGVDRTVRMIGGDLPAPMVLSMTLMEYVAHGWDLAAATSQPVPFSDAELVVALERARATLPDQYRGEGQPFGKIVDTPQSAPTLDRFLGFMGRTVPFPA